MNPLIKKAVKLVNTELFLHPKAELVDIYKLFFQSFFGPGHFIDDVVGARHWLEDEYKKMKFFNKNPVQNLSLNNQYIRADLCLIRNNGLDLFFDLFIKSVEPDFKISYRDWLIFWKRIVFFLKLNYPDLLIKDSINLVDKLLVQRSVPKHSDVYRLYYSPHYRLIKKKYLKYLTF